MLSYYKQGALSAGERFGHLADSHGCFPHCNAVYAQRFTLWSICSPPPHSAACVDQAYLPPHQGHRGSILILTLVIGLSLLPNRQPLLAANISSQFLRCQAVLGRWKELWFEAMQPFICEKVYRNKTINWKACVGGKPAAWNQELCLPRLTLAC